MGTGRKVTNRVATRNVASLFVIIEEGKL